MASPYQDLRRFAGDQPPLLPLPIPPVPQQAAPAVNWQALAQFAPPAPPPRTHGKGSVQQITPERSYGPLGDLAQQHVDELRYTGQMPPSPGFTELLPMMPFAPPAAGVDAAARGVGALVSRFPTTATAAAGAAGLTAAPTAAEPPDVLSTARDTIGRLRASRTQLQDEQTRLMAERGQFDRVNSADKEAVKEIQRRLGIKVDGIWSSGTSKAIADHRANVERQIGRLDGQLGKLTDDIENQERRLTGLEGGERLREAEESVGPVQQMLRDWGPLAGFGVGGLAGHWTRTRAAHRVAGQSATRAREIDQRLLPQPGARAPRSDARAANVNEFWREGGAGEAVPFRTVQTGRGFARRPNAAEASDLYPPGPTRFRGADYGMMGAGAAEAGVSGVFAHQAHQELSEAQAAVQADPSAINIDRLQRARDAVAFTETLWRAGAGFAAGRLGGAYTHPYREARPNVAAGEREVMTLNQLLARDAKKAKAGRRTK